MNASPATPIGLVHGYGFSGAGSNLWTRSMLRALCKQGFTVHVVCQEARPENFEFVDEAIAYDAEGLPRRLFARDTPFPGRCTVHRPDLEVLPVYVAPRQESTYVRPIPELDDATIEEYVRRNAAVLLRVAIEHEVAGYCVNHVVLSSVAAMRVKHEIGVPYAVLPHGSAIEYVVKKDERMREAATQALSAADIVFALNGEMEGRMRDVFGAIPDLEGRLERLPVGVDTAQFIAAGRDERQRLIHELLAAVEGESGGRGPEQKRALTDRLDADLDDHTLLDAVRVDTRYRSEAPDTDLADTLASVDWSRDRIVTYVGRLIAAKGAPTVLLAFPEILARHPDARLVIAGTGALREAMEALVHALSEGDATLIHRIVEIGEGFETGRLPGEPLLHPRAFITHLMESGRWDDYVSRVSRHLEPRSVLFTGFLDHEPLSRLYAVSDVGVFPSVVREASPLVVPEAAASGTLPVGTDFGGMGDSLRNLGRHLPDAAAELMTIRYEAEHTIRDLIENVSLALDEPGKWAAQLRKAAKDHYDWQSIATRLAERLVSHAKRASLPGGHR